MSNLPDWGSEECRKLIAEYPYCTAERLAELAQQYNYRNIDSFQRQMRKQLGVLRSAGVNVGWEPEGLNIPLKLQMAKEPKKVLNWGDFHCPYQDNDAMALAEELVYDIQPDIIVYNGDLGDFYQVSKFDKNPQRIPELQADINAAKAILRRHKIRYPNTERKLIGGTHEVRFQKFLWTSAKELAGLSCLTIPELFNLSEYGIEYIPFEQGLMINDVFLVLHGDIASIHSSYTAKRLYEKHGGCGMCNHTHRGGAYFKRDRFGTWGWWENFCMCHLNPDWIKNPNWQQGLSLIHFLGKRFWVEQIPIIDNSLMYGGKVYKKR